MKIVKGVEKGRNLKQKFGTERVASGQERTGRCRENPIK